MIVRAFNFRIFITLLHKPSEIKHLTKHYINEKLLYMYIAIYTKKNNYKIRKKKHSLLLEPLFTSFSLLSLLKIFSVE